MITKLKLILNWIPETVSLTLFGVNFLLSLINHVHSFDKPKQNDTSLPPIIIFEQWISKNYWHILMKRYLEVRGFRVYWTNYSLINGGIEDGAEYLGSYIEKNKLNNAVLVGISMGALSSFVYLQRYGGWSKIKKFISISGPFKGTPLSFAPKLILGVDEIDQNSRFLKKLKSEKIKNPARIVCVAALSDEIVPPENSFLSKTKNILIKVRGHNYLHMFSEEVFQSIAREARSAN